MAGRSARVRKSTGPPSFGGIHSPHPGHGVPRLLLLLLLKLALLSLVYYKRKTAVCRRPGLLWQSSAGVPSDVMVYLRVLARTGRRAVCARALAFLPPLVLLPCRYFASSGCAPKDVGTRKSPLYSARRFATAGLQLAAVIMTRIRIIRRCTRGRFAPTPALWKASSSYRSIRAGKPLHHIAPYGPWHFASVRNAASFFVYFVGVHFSCGG